MFVINIIISSVIISLCAWLAKKRPELAGFIISLPLSTLLVLGLSGLQNDDVKKTVVLAKSIFIAIPSTLVFFIPFLLAERLKISFWTAYGVGILLLPVGFLIHRTITTQLMR